ncbi:MAG TPA: hypothetical protein VJV79_06940 [Polyangiaceae bacterium]|nr:hypothetical protein [Polyangiaceae bacterium]
MRFVDEVGQAITNLGLALGATRVFRIPRHEVGKLYRAEVHVQQDTFVLFDQLPSTSNGDAVML